MSTIENKEVEDTTIINNEQVESSSSDHDDEEYEFTEEQIKELNELNKDSNDNNPFGERTMIDGIVESMETLAMTNEKTTANYLIVDTNALISGVRLETLGKELWTIPDVLEEVKDKKTSNFLTSFPFEIKTRQPTVEAIRAVTEFSMKTGDYPSLSAADIRLIALTYTFEQQVNGLDHIKTQPELLQVQTQKPIKSRPTNNNNNNENKPNNNNKKNKKTTTTTTTTTTESTTTPTPTTTTETEQPKTTEQSTDKPKKKRRSKKSKKSTTDNNNNIATETKEKDSCCDCDHDDEEEEEETTTTTTTTKEKEVVEIKSNDESVNNNTNNNETTNNNNTSINKKKKNNKLKVDLEKIEEQVSNEKVVDPNEVLRQLKIKQAEEAEERKKNRVIKVEEEGEWITPENLSSKLSSTYVQEKVHYDVGCITRDFAMQNVILQMGLHLISADGIVIKQVKQFVLKCVACLNITTDMEKIFCGHCGNKSLYKATTYVDRNGNQRVSVGSAKQFNLRGTIYSIPKAKGGKKNNDLILTEDQYLHKLRVTGQLYKKKASKEINLNDLELGFGHKGPSDDIIIGYGNKNPNIARKKIGKKNKSISIF